MKKAIYTLSFATLLCNGIMAQQIFKISQYTQHNFLYNPAAAGAADNASVGATYRKMWAGIDGSPQTTFLFGDKYFDKKKTGVAVALYDDKTGPTTRTGGQLNLSYHVDMGDNKKILLGLGAQFMQFKVDLSAIAKYIPNDPLLASSGNTFKGDASAGVYYKSPTLNFGISVAQLIQAKLNLIKGTKEEGKLYRHYFIGGHYNWKTDEDNVLIPNMMIKYLPNTPLDFEIGLRNEYKDFIWVGFNYHQNQSYSAFAGIKADKKLAIGYAFDQYKTPISLFDAGGSAHEISLRYFFTK